MKLLPLLCQAHPAGARCWAWGGRLPIHMLASQSINKHSAADDDDDSIDQQTRPWSRPTGRYCDCSFWPFRATTDANAALR